MATGISTWAVRGTCQWRRGRRRLAWAGAPQVVRLGRLGALRSARHQRSSPGPAPRRTQRDRRASARQPPWGARCRGPGLPWDGPRQGGRCGGTRRGAGARGAATRPQRQLRLLPRPPMSMHSAHPIMLHPFALTAGCCVRRSEGFDFLGIAVMKNTEYLLWSRAPVCCH